MENQITLTIKNILKEISPLSQGVSIEVKRNVVKEVLQYYILNFIYHHPKYNNWIMYGGSALRICHDLDRMSVDLDFEVQHAITNDFLNTLKEELLSHFENMYTVDNTVLTIGITNNRGLTLKFQIAEELGLPFHSKQIHVKIDLNHFAIHPNMATARWPQQAYQLSFTIQTYNMSALMASKIAAIFLRGTRGIVKNIYEEKGRDIYDLLWYMGKKVIPDLDYLKAKEVREAHDLHSLFNKLTLKMNMVSDENLKNDLTPLFTNQIYIEDWLKNWREKYLRLLDTYEMYTITGIEQIMVEKDFYSDNFSFTYIYTTKEGKLVEIRYHLSGYWVMFREGDLTNNIDKKLMDKITFSGLRKTSTQDTKDKLIQYVNLFYQKTEKYFKTTNQTILGDTIETKRIIMTADNFNQKEQILLNKSTLINCELDDLLK